MPELGSYGSVRGARGNSRPYREHPAGGLELPILVAERFCSCTPKPTLMKRERYPADRRGDHHESFSMRAFATKEFSKQIIRTPACGVRILRPLQTTPLGRQHQSLEFLASGTKTTKLVNRRSRWRERKRLVRFG